MNDAFAPFPGGLFHRSGVPDEILEPAPLVRDWEIQVLVVAREASARSIVSEILSEEGFRTIEDEDGRFVSALLETTFSNPQSFPFHLVVLESQLSRRNGLDLCQRLRLQKIFVPILILNDRDRQGDRILGLERGADVCLSQPFDSRELVALCRSLLRRFLGYWSQFSVLQFESVKLDTWEHRVWVRDREITLSPQEFRLLGLLMRHPGRVWTREELLDRVWKSNVHRSTKTVDVHISQLRKKIEPDPKNPKYIQTIPGRGYQFG
ncbi:MAG: response regulator transcription factor [Cyanobacteria bacterium SID2]|nr:response regulator transcription factor [Cyanobacteria bacterium SID2]